MRSASVAAVRGFGQIFLQPAAWCGVFVCAAFVVADARMAVLAALGLGCSMLGGAALRVDGAELRAGLHGFCGALVGAAAFVMLGAGGAGVAATVTGGLLCGPVTVGLARLFATRPLAALRLPGTTAPFCLVAWGIHYLTRTAEYDPMTPAAPSVSLVVWAGHAVLTGISQVVLIDDVRAGVLILIGLALAHWSVGLAAGLGSAVGSVVAALAGMTPVNVYHGLGGYSSVLTAIALACVFLAGRWSWGSALVGAVAAALLTRAMLVVGLPPFTWPFVLVTWALLVMAHLLRVPRR